MADNVELSAGTGGAVIATDDDGTAHHQYVKLEFGADNTQTKVSAANPLPVTGTVDLGATDNAVLDDIAAKLATIDADTSTLAAAVSTEYQVDVVGALPAGDQAIGRVKITDGTDVALVDGSGNLQVGVGTALPAGDNNIGNVDIASIAAGNNNIGDVDVASIAAGTNAIGNVGLIGRASGGMTIFRSIDIDESEEEVKASAGQVFSITAFNRTAAPLYLKFYNETAANVTVGTTTPVLTFVVPGNADSDGAGFVWNNPIGFAFSTGICVAATTGIADNDTTGPGANECIVLVGYA